MKIWLKFRYENKEYTIERKDFLPYKIGDTWEWYWWTEGNGACDCNRSSFIKEKYPDFPELNCTHNIELLDYNFL